MKYDYASTEVYMTELCRKVFNPGLKGIDNIVIALPGQGHMSLIKSLIELRNIPYSPNKILRDNFDSEIENTFFIILNPNTYTSIDDSKLYEDLLIQISNNKKSLEFIDDRDRFLIQNIPIARQKAHQLFAEISKNHNIFLIIQPVLTLKHIDKEILKYLISLKSINNNHIKLIFNLCRFNEKHLGSIHLQATLHTYIKPLDFTEVDYQLRKLFHEFRHKPDSKIIKNIYKLSSGIAGIMKLLALDYLSGVDVNNDSLKTNQNIQNYIHDIRKILYPDEFLILRKLHVGKSQIDTSSFMNNTGLTELSDELLSEIIQPDNDHDFTIDLPPVLLKLYKLLREHRDQLITKVDIAKSIWGEETYHEKYSDWAIDRYISDIRKILTKDESIITKRGRGYVFKSSLF